MLRSLESLLQWYGQAGIDEVVAPMNLLSMLS